MIAWIPLCALEYFIMITKQRDNKESETKKTSKFPNIVRSQWWDSTPPKYWVTAPYSSSPTPGILLLSQSLDDLGTTQGECLGRTWWSSLLDLATYLYYLTSGCVFIITWSHVLPEPSMITWPCHVIWLPNFPCYLYLDPITRLNIRDQMFECMGDSFLSRALITSPSHNGRVSSLLLGCS